MIMRKRNAKSSQEVFNENFSMWIISTHGTRFRSRLLAADLNLDEDDIDDNVNLGTKDMISRSDRIYLNKTRSQVRNFLKRGIAKRSFGRGLYSVPDYKMVACEYGLQKIKQAQKERVEEFISRYPEEKKKQTKKHPNLIQEDWPTAEEIRAFYDLTWIVVQLTPVQITEKDNPEQVQIKKKFQQDLAKGYDNLKDQILGESYVAILDAISKISQKIDANEGITETNFKRPRALIEEYLSIASIFDLPQIQQKVEQVQAALGGANAKELRDRPLIAKQFADKMKVLGDQIADLTGYSKDGRLKRAVDMDE